MNYLAHFYLSGNSTNLIIGNFLADFVKGKQYQEYAIGVQEGILLHREIDRFTDQHQRVGLTKKRLYSTYHKYAPVIVDMYYDHMLAANWERYSKQELIPYTQHIYAVLKKHRESFPKRAQLTLEYMEMHNWLYSYASLSGIGKALSGMSRRTAFQSNMEHSINDLKRDYKHIQQDFEAFMPQLITHVKVFQKHK
jgi:acyl carrier protein phosphodiesterase